MATFYWQPSEPLFNSVSSIRRQLDDVFLQESSAANADKLTDATVNDRTERYWQPRYELIDTPESFLVHVQLPGIAAEDIAIEATHQAVMVSGHQSITPLGDRHKVLYSEFPQGKFYQIVELPLDINCEKIQADFHNGLLSLELPKSDRYRPVKVQVNAKPMLEKHDEQSAGQKRLEADGSETDSLATDRSVANSEVAAVA